jgi:class 3 adenylate cyclase/pimeloyl-ACP methyl ester carboxylesterase
MERPETRYVTTADGVEIAYQRFGRDGRDIAWVQHMLFGIDLLWDAPPIVRWLEGLGSLGRVLIRDIRGTGLSDRAVEPGDAGTDVTDLMAILDHEGIERVAMIGNLRGAAVAALAAATHPARVSELVLWHPIVRSAWAPDFPWGASDVELAEELATMESAWGTTAHGAAMASGEGPVGSVDLSFQDWVTRSMRAAATPARARRLVQRFQETDVRDILSSISVPTLILAREGGRPEARSWVASQIPGSTEITLDGRDFMPWFGDLPAVIEAIGRFLGVERGVGTGSRFLATVLFTDIVDSTSRAAGLGDAAWGELIRRHHGIVRDRLSRFGGREQDTAGDGFFAVFDAPADAARCALAIAEAVRVVGLEVRAGVHTGECHMADGKVAGLAVSIGARIAGEAPPSGILVSSTVKELVAGSGLVFEDAGEHELKGVPDRWRLYRVTG